MADLEHATFGSPSSALLKDDFVASKADLLRGTV
jgi:hypothetical protein